MPERRFTFVRHASTVYNGLGLLNGDRACPCPSTPRGASLPLRSRPQFAHAAARPRRAHALRAHARDADAAAGSAPRRAGRDRARLRRRRRREFEGGDVGLPRLARAARARAGGARGREPAGGARPLCRRLRAPARPARCARVLLVVHDVPIRFLHNALLGADPLDGPVRTVANLERLMRGRAATRRRAGGHAAQALRPPAGLIPGSLSDRSARSGRRAPGARCRIARPPLPADDDRSRCKASDACYKYAANYNKLSIRTMCKPPIELALESREAPATIARCGRRSSRAVRAASASPWRVSSRAVAAGSWCSPRGARSRWQAAAGELAATAVRCDVTDDGDVEALVAAARAAGGCDLLVHSAGAPARVGVLDADLATYRTAFELNYIGLVRVATAFWPLLEASRGRLVPVVSVAGHGRARALGAVRVGQERRAVVGALLRRRRTRARRGGHDRQPRARADARLPAECAAAQPLGAADRGRRRALRRAPAGGRRPPRARGVRAAVVARSRPRCRERRPRSRRAWRRAPGARARIRVATPEAASA